MNLPSGPYVKITVSDEGEGISPEHIEKIFDPYYTTKNGEETIKVYNLFIKKGSHIDAVIMDLTIPGGMGGKEAARALLTKHPMVKVIVSSGYTTDPVMENYQDYGFCDRITKPYELEELSRIVARVVAKRT